MRQRRHAGRAANRPAAFESDGALAEVRRNALGEMTLGEREVGAHISSLVYALEFVRRGDVATGSQLVLLSQRLLVFADPALFVRGFSHWSLTYCRFPDDAGPFEASLRADFEAASRGSEMSQVAATPGFLPSMTRLEREALNGLSAVALMLDRSKVAFGAAARTSLVEMQAWMAARFRSDTLVRSLSHWLLANCGIKDMVAFGDALRREGADVRALCAPRREGWVTKRVVELDPVTGFIKGSVDTHEKL